LSTSTPEPAPAEAALQASGLAYRIVRHGRVGSLVEAARVRGVEPSEIIKTLVVRRADRDYLFVLVPGDREISWPKLRAVLGVSRISMPDAETAREVTGYERGTITPFGAHTAWPVLADGRIGPGEISLGAGEHGAAVIVEAGAALAALGAQVADITDPVA
jgi:Cys-tRNA(Pro)/Cys-tRNA(Cys) deacylase